MAEDEDYEQDSEAYRKWRSGEDNDKYASSKNPTETGSKSGSYSIPKPNKEYKLPGEDDDSRLNDSFNWSFAIGAFAVLALIVASVFASVIADSEGKDSSEWPSVEGTISNKFVLDKFVTDEYCEDYNEDGYLDDDECWKDFVYVADLTYSYTDKNENNLSLKETVEFWESHWVDIIKTEGEDKLFQEFVNETEERSKINTTVIIFYNPDLPSEAYSEFTFNYEEPLGFVGAFFMCLGGLLCVPIVIGGFVMSWAQRATSNGGDYRGNRWSPFGGSGYNSNRGAGRNGRAVRRSGGSSRSGGGGRSGSGSRGGGGRSGGGGRRR